MESGKKGLTWCGILQSRNGILLSNREPYNDANHG